MKRLLIIILIFFAYTAQAQTYTYKPLNLDTSSFWIHDYLNYSGGSGYPKYNRGEIVSFVEKDTIIGVYTYHKIVGYVTNISQLELPIWFGPERLYVTYLREDTAAKKIYERFNNNDTLYVDYSLNINDTVNTSVYNSSNSSPGTLDWVIDSVRNENYFGISRRLSFWMHTPVAAQPNFAIEGVGMNYQFPFNIGGGEWNAPGFTCKCYSSKDTVRYLWNEQFNGVFPIDSCYKKERIKQWAIGVNDNKKDPTIFFVNNSLSLRTAYAINYKVYNSIGALVLSEKSASHYYEKDLSYLPAGIYIVHLKFKNERLVKKILIN